MSAELDEAWTAAQAVLPEGWNLQLVRRGYLAPSPNPVTGHPLEREYAFAATAWPQWQPNHDDWLEVEREADGPAEALRALAATLTETPR